MQLSTRSILGMVLLSYVATTITADSQTQGYVPGEEPDLNITAEESEGVGGTSELPPLTIDERVDAVLACYNASTCRECEERPECSWCGGRYNKVEWRPMCFAHKTGECWHSPFDGMKSGHRRTSVDQCPGDGKLGRSGILQVPISYNLYSPAHVAHLL
jgi:hypothetical protein